MQHCRNQGGFALLIFVLMLLSMAGVIGTNYLNKSLLEIKKKKLNDNQQVLEIAKFALLQYAYNYPDFSPTNGGPGRLPCPDDDNDGNAEIVLNCGSGTAGFTMIGRFPYLQTGLNVEDLRDSSGSRLWYAVSHNFSWVKGAPNIINATSEGTISLSDVTGSIINDSSADGGGIVAVIIAPGEQITRYEPAAYTQVRTTVAEQVDPRNYLEIAFGIDNTTFEFGDRDTATGVDDVNGFIKGPVYDSNRRAIISNDQFITITREEITKFALKRVVDEIPSVLSDYQNEFSPILATYPWLYDADYSNPQFDFSDPSGDIYNVEAFGNRVDQTRTTEKGLLPVLTDAQRYSTEIRFRWNLNENLVVNNNLPNPPIEILDSELSTFESFAEDLQSNYTVDQCLWRTAGAVTCDTGYSKTAWYVETSANTWTRCLDGLRINCLNALPLRSYALTVGNTLSFQNNAPTNLQKTAAVDNISLDELEIRFNFSGGNTLLADLITNNLFLYPVKLDVKQYIDKATADADLLDTVEEATIDIAALAGGVYVSAATEYVSLTTRYFPADSWFADNEWNQFMVLEYEDDFKPGGASVTCDPLVDVCMTLNGYEGVITNIDAIALFSGEHDRKLAGWPSNNASDYFEEDNLIDDRLYSLDSIDINDIIKVIAP